MAERKTGVFPLNYLTDEDRDIFTDSEVAELMFKTFEYLRTGVEPKFSKRIMAVRFRDHREFFEENRQKFEKKIKNLKWNHTESEQNHTESELSHTESVLNQTDIAYENEYEYENENIDISKKKIIKEKASTFEQLIDNYSTSPDLRKALREFLRHRTRIKAPMTDYSLKLILNKLDKLSTSDQEKIQLLETAMERGWKSVFKDEDREKSGYQKHHDQLMKLYQEAEEDDQTADDNVLRLPF